MSTYDIQLEIVRVLQIAKEMEEVYKLHMLDGNGFERYVNDFWDLCKERTKREININYFDKLPGAKAGARGHCFKVKNPGGTYRYDIGIKNGMNECWQRFVKCKELFHVLLDDENPDQYSEETLRHVQECLSELPELLRPAGSEEVAEYGAAEFLFPYNIRLQHFGRDKTKEEFLATAKIYKIPQVYVETFLSAPFMNYFGVLSKLI
jgi:hypothetical protein